MRKRIVAVGCVALLAACETTPPKEAGKPPVTMKVQRGVPSDRMFGSFINTVRTVSKDANGKEVDVENATCTIRSKELYGKVQSPSRIVTPSFLQADRFPLRGKPGNLTVTCTAGKLKGARTFEPFPGRTSSRTSSSYDPNNPVTVTLITSSASPVRSSYPWGYQTILEVPLQ